MGLSAIGLNRGIKSGIDIALALKGEQRRERQYKAGLEDAATNRARGDEQYRNQQVLFSQKQALFNQNRDDRQKRDKAEELKRLAISDVMLASNFESPDAIDDETLTRIGNNSGALQMVLKPNQENGRYATIQDGEGKSHRVIQFNQKGEDGKVVLGADGQPQWFTLSKNRGTDDDYVTLTGSDIISHSFAAYAQNGVNPKLMTNPWNKAMSEREKMKQQHDYAVDLENRKFKHQASIQSRKTSDTININSQKTKSGSNAKPIIKTEKYGKGDKVTYKHFIIDPINQTRTEIKRKLTPLEAESAATEEAKDKATWMNDDKEDFGGKTREEWIKIRTQELLGVSGKPNAGSPPVLSNKAISVIDDLMGDTKQPNKQDETTKIKDNPKPKPKPSGKKDTYMFNTAGLSSVDKANTKPKKQTIETIKAKMKKIENRKTNSPLSYKHTKEYKKLEKELDALESAEKKLLADKRREEYEFNRGLSSTSRSAI